MLTLDKLPPPVLLRVVDEFYDNEEEETPAQAVRWCDWPEEGREVYPAKEAIALSGVCRSLRQALQPSLFQHLLVGGSRATKAYAKKLAELAECSEEMLKVVRVIHIGSLLPDAIRAFNQVLKRMVHVERIEYFACLPFPPLFVETLSEIPTFGQLFFGAFGVESLPHILPIAHKLTHFRLDTELEGPDPVESLTLCPITVAVMRRTRKPWGDTNVPTAEEQRQAVIKHLPPVLLRASSKLVELSLHGEGISGFEEPMPWLQPVLDACVGDNREYPAFPRLEKLWLASIDAKTLALKYLLKAAAKTLTVLEVTTGEHKELPAPRYPLQALQHFCYLFTDDLSCVEFVNGVTRDSPLRTLYINGLRPSDLDRVFQASEFRCGNTLTQLRLKMGRETRVGGGSMPYRLEQVRMVVASCPHLVAFDMKGNWAMEATDVLDAIQPLTDLHRFCFDHPWERPRDFPFPSPDGRTIRSERKGDFRIISLVGKSMKEVIHDRIAAEIDAVRPTYRTHFTRLAKKMPSLQHLYWQATQEVLWTWTFERRRDPGGCVKVLCLDKPHIPYEGVTAGESVPRPGIYMTG